MAKEITATFQNGGIFNGFANSYTINGETTYYFDIDKRYRVAVTDDGQIVNQQYQNTNGAWYNINIITKIEINDISGGGSGDVTLEYLQKNYYTKTETDNRYVKKSGDTMTGALFFKFDGYRLSILSNKLTIESGEGTYTRLLQLYNNNVNVYRGNINMRLGAAGSSIGTTINNNGFYVYDSNGTDIGYMQQENNRGTVGIHIFNNSRIVLHSGKPGTVEPFIQLQENGINGYYDAILKINALMTTTNKVTFNSEINSNAAAIFNQGLTSKGNILVDSTSSNSQTTISPNNIRIESDTNYTTYNAGAIYMYKGSTLDVAMRVSRGVDVYNGGSMIIHGGTGDKQTAYTYLGFNTYNLTSNDTWSINMGNARFELRNAYTAIFYSNNLMRLQAGTQLAMVDSGGSIVVSNIIKALNNAFYGEEFLKALNKVFLFIFNKIGGAVYYEFPSQNYGGGITAGGGSSRGGGVGRR